MFKNYLKIALRNIKRYKGYSFINIAGLAVGMACCILILLWVRDELSFDRFHHNLDDIYRVVRVEQDTADTGKDALTPPPLAAALKEKFPEITHSTRFGTWGRWVFAYGEKSFYESRYKCVDPDFFRMFTFPFVKGSPKQALVNTYSVVISEEMAEKYFGNEEPLGKTLNINQQFDVIVTGVIKNIPENSTLKFDFILPFKLLFLEELLGEETAKNWGFNSFNTFVMLNKQSSVKELTAKIAGIFKEGRKEEKDLAALQPFKDIHLYSNIKYDLPGIGDIKYVTIFSMLALFVLIIACINFMNLTTAKSAKRAKEVGLRKVIGARRSQLIKQFFGESVLLSFFAFLFALILVELMLPAFNQLAAKNLSLNPSNNIFIYLGFVGITLLTGILAGSYPALLLSSFQPVKVLKGSANLNVKDKNRSPLFRRILVVTQFSLSIALVIGTIVIYTQLRFMRSKDLGFNKEHVIYIAMAESIIPKYDSIKKEFRRDANVLTVTASLSLPINIRNSPGSPEWEGKDPDNNMQIKADFVDYDYLETFHIKMVQGRTFSKKFPTDTETAYIVNEEAVRRMGLESPVGKQFSFWDRKGKIIGVMKDFHFRPMHHQIQPIVFKIFPPWFKYIYTRLKPGNIPAALDSLKKTWIRLNPGYPFEYHFLDDRFDGLYRAEQRMGTLTKYFTVLGILIACLGLFGLASFTAEQRTKEIGVRKVLGASVGSIIALLSREFTRLVLVATIIAWPVAYFTMNQWLQNFAYQVGIAWWIFIFSAGLTVIIALLTVSYQSIKAAVTNPVEALRYE
ncbi:MAG: ABC transporter permease [Candidatus Aminicenantes bacterium]|nr:MAG: ABC transporter permease [Candidatus Aminicenantes bacterium]